MATPKTYSPIKTKAPTSRTRRSATADRPLPRKRVDIMPSHGTVTTAPFLTPDKSVSSSPQAQRPTASLLPKAAPLTPWVKSPPLSYGGTVTYVPS
jgi:hypothetical protein